MKGLFKMDSKKQTPFGYVSKKVFAELRKAGWSPDRDEAGMADSFSKTLGPHWVPAAAPFVRNFGGLSFYGRLWAWKEPIRDQDIVADESKVAEVAGSIAVPVASSSYLGDGCVIWIDESGRYYAVDSEGMIFVGDNMAATLEVLLGGDPPPEPPPELKEKLAAAYDWSENSDAARAES